MTQNISLENLSSAIQEKAAGHKHFLITISGFGGSGKSTIAQKLAKILGETTLIRLDDFIVDRLTERSAEWSGFDWSRLTEQVLLPIKEEKDDLVYDVYDWQRDTLGEKKKVVLSKYVILEGVGLIKEQLKQYYDCSIWVDVPLEIAIQRGKKRDKEEYGAVDHDEKWENLWSQNDKDYFEKYQPQMLADFVVMN